MAEASDSPGALLLEMSHVLKKKALSLASKKEVSEPEGKRF